VNFPCELCKNDHLTHLCPKLAEAMRLLSQSPSVLKNPFPDNQHLASISSKEGNATSGSQNPPSQDDHCLCINMVDAKVHVGTQTHNYSSSHGIPGIEYPPPPLETNLLIEKLE
jgi:hypothetical protein